MATGKCGRYLSAKTSSALSNPMSVSKHIGERLRNISRQGERIASFNWRRCGGDRCGGTKYETVGERKCVDMAGKERQCLKLVANLDVNDFSKVFCSVCG